MEKVFKRSQPLAMPNGPLHPMVLMVGKQPLMPMDFGDTSIGLGGMAMVFIESLPLPKHNPLLVTETSFKFTIR